MISPSEIKQKAEKQYARFLSSTITGDPFFPYSFPVGALPKDYMVLKKAVTELMNASSEGIGYGYSLTLKGRKTRDYGEQSLPCKICIETETDYLKLLKKEKAFLRFKADVALIQSSMPELRQWICRNPLQVTENHGSWLDLIKVCRYFINNPRPNLYIRELPIAVHTKFVEQNRKVLRSLLEELLPADQLELVEAGQNYAFEKRFSLRYPESLIRIRILDPDIQQKYGFQTADMSVVISDFNRLRLGTPRCFITENMLPFLTLPPLTNSIAILGEGYALSRLRNAAWLLHCPIFYWGDMDIDGFTMLSQMRSHFPQTQSVMMNPQTYERFQNFAVKVDVKADVKNAEAIAHLTPEEQALYTYLAEQRQRLEQERISQGYVNQHLQA